MRLAYVCADAGVPVFGTKGCSVHVQEMLRAFRALGIEVELIAARWGGEPPADLSDIVCHELAPGCEKPRFAGQDGSARLNASLAKLLARRGPFDGIYERHALWSHAAMETARAWGVPGWMEINAPIVEEHARYRFLVDRALAEALARRALRSASVLLPVSHALAEGLERDGLPASRIEVLPNGVNLYRIRPDVPPVRPARPETFVVGFLGSLKPWHGLEFLAGAFARLLRAVPQSRLRIIGDGPERPALEERLRSLGAASATEILGAVPPGEIPGLLTSLHVGVAPYGPLRGFYFSPLKIYEYMAAGLPVVASRIGQIPGAVRHGVEGLLVPPGDVPALGAALGRLAGDPALRAVLGRAARRRVEAGHGWTAVARRVIERGAGSPPALLRAAAAGPEVR